MKYEKIQNDVDKKHDIIRVIGICFEKDASDDFIEEVVEEVLNMDTLQPALMTAKALFLQMEALDEYVLERMAVMPIGRSFNFNGTKITRWSKHTYNGTKIGRNLY